MISYIIYQSKRCRTLRLKISPKGDFNKIFHTLNSITFPGLRANSSHIIYALLELVNNSLRAHHEQSNSERIILEFNALFGRLLIRIEDRGGGFNPDNLPYDLNDFPENIELNSPDFQSYREKNGYLRFGMGLFIAKRTFPSFQLSFVDPKGNKTAWETGEVAGTRIILGFGEGTYGKQ